MNLGLDTIIEKLEQNDFIKNFNNLIDSVKKVSGIREYSDTDLERIEFILCMKNAGLSLEEIKENPILKELILKNKIGKLKISKI